VSPWKVILATMVIFGCGVITGGLVVKVNTHPRFRPDLGTRLGSVKAGLNNPALPVWQMQRMEFLHKMDKQLQLTPEQREHIEKIMRESNDRTRHVWDQIQPEMKNESHRVREEIRRELTPDQLKQFNELLKAHPKTKLASTNAAPLEGQSTK
jgi:hypothetical protein